MDFMREWVAFFKGEEDGKSRRYKNGLPFSFRCGRWKSEERLSLQNAQKKQELRSEGKCVHTFEWKAIRSPLVCSWELTEFQDFPAVEWVVKLRNEGEKETENISDFKALDMTWTRNDDSIPKLYRSLGSDARADDFKYVCDELRSSIGITQGTIRMNSVTNGRLRSNRGSYMVDDNRPSTTWLPFFNLQTGDDGMIIVLGWSGQWFAEFLHDGDGKVDLSAGMECLNTRLLPGESIRSPRVLILYWKGVPLHGQNVLRRFLLARYTPQDRGKPVEPPLCNGTWGGVPTTEHKAMIREIVKHDLPYDCYWVDAGWYGTAAMPSPNVFRGKWMTVGDWRVNRNYHPEGLKPLSDAIHKAGMKFLLWVEPGRAIHGTPVTLEHPEWFLRRENGPRKENEVLLLNFGLEEAREWAVETVSKLISENGIDWYREDFNIDPSPFWRHADVNGRKGIVEVKYVEGFYAFWDELLERYPGLLIDNCASGGRKLELETISRSIALWRTDYNCFSYLNPNAFQAQGFGLHHWLPPNATSPNVEPGDTYQFRSALSAGLVFGLDNFGLSRFNASTHPWNWHRKMLLEAKRARPCFYGDFFPLTQCDVSSEAWLAYQMHSVQSGEGILLAFRRESSRIRSMSLLLHSVRCDRKYCFEDADNGRKWMVDGSKLQKSGLPIRMNRPRSSKLFFYKEISVT